MPKVVIAIAHEGRPFPAAIQLLAWHVFDQSYPPRVIEKALLRHGHGMHEVGVVGRYPSSCPTSGS
jgi:hypothetical protein